MTLQIEPQELTLAIAVQNYNPITLTPDFLKYSGIVPTDWELAQPPVLSPSTAKIVFQSGVTIAAQINRIVFSERLEELVVAEISIAAIARKFVQSLSQVAYQGVVTGFRGHVAFPSEPSTAAHDYLLNLLAAGQWRSVAPMQPVLQLTYRLQDAQLSLEISEAGLRVKEEPATVTPVVIFTGNFLRNLPETEKINSLIQILNDWQQDLATYQELINHQFLGEENESNVIPMINAAAM